MNKLSLLAGMAIGAALTAGVAQLQAQAPAAANTTRPAVFVITEQTLLDEKKYTDEYVPKVLPTIKANGGRFIVRTNEVTGLAGHVLERQVRPLARKQSHQSSHAKLLVRIRLP